MDRNDFRTKSIARVTNFVLAAMVVLLLTVSAGVVNAADTTPPTITSFDFTPKSIDVSSSDATITVSLTLSDPSGIPTTGIGIPRAHFTGSSGIDYAVIIPNESSANLIIPRRSEPGTYTLFFISAYDNAGNYTFYNATEVQQLGFPTTFDVTRGPATYTVNTSVAGTGGTISCTPATVTEGQSSVCTIVPADGYQLSNLTDNGVSVTSTEGSYTINAISVDHTIVASFSAALLNGTCGASNGQTLTAAPTTNLCSVGTATAVSGIGPWTWSCMGLNGGANANCSAYIQTWTVTPSAGSGGSISPNSAQTVTHGSTQSFAITPNSGHTASVGGSCGGTLSGNTYTTNPVTANCMVSVIFSATPVNGTCGASNGQTSTTAPTINLCSVGTATPVSGIGPWTWGCMGSNGGTTALCSVTLSTNCTYILPSISAFYGTQDIIGAVTIYATPNCSWTAVSNALWITITAGSNGSGNGNAVFYITANTGPQRTGTITIGDKTFTITQAGSNQPLYFPHVDTSLPWQTEIAIINTSDQTVTGTLRGMSDEGQLIDIKSVTLSARGRREIIIANEFANHTDIGYIVFDTTSAAVQGYTKFYQAGIYRTAIPAVKEVNSSDIYIPHIDSSAQWWTGVSLVNTTSATKEMTITFNNGLSVPYTLNAHAHRVFTIGDLLNQPLQPDIKSAVITNASGIIGLELFGNIGGSNHLDGLLLTGNTASTLYYPQVAGDGWWTGIGVYNPSESACTITITPYSVQGAALSPSTRSVAAKEKYVGLVSDLGLPAQMAWFKIDSTQPLTGFELFGTIDGKQLAAYAGGGGTGAKSGVFAKIEKSGWTGIAFVNTEDSTASVRLTAYNDSGIAVATQVLTVDGHAKVANLAEMIFSQDISSATYIAYSSDKNVVGYQLNGSSSSDRNVLGYPLNGSSDGMILDGLPALGDTN